MNPSTVYILDNPYNTTEILAEDFLFTKNPMTAIGQLIYGKAAGVPDKVNANITTTRKYLSEQGTGTAGTEPTWETPDANDISNTPAGSIEATTVQDAINELDSDVTGISSDVAEIDMSLYVPYTGATGDIDLGSQNLTTTGTITASTFVGDLVPYTGASDNVDLGANSLIANQVTIAGTVANNTDAATKEYVDQAIIDAHGLDGVDGSNGDDGADGAEGLQGAPGVDGDDGGPGPGVLFRGEYSESATYYNNDNRRDIVKYDDHYYLYAGDSPSTPGVWNGDDWDSFGDEFDSVATNILFANFAYIDNLGVREFEGVTRGVGDLDGTVDHTVANSPGVHQVETITLTGTEGTAVITQDGVGHLVRFNETLTKTAADFVEVATYADITLTSDGPDIIFTADVAGVGFAAPTIANTPNTYLGAIKIQGNEIWEDVQDDDQGTIIINNRSYDGGQTRYRTVLIKDGKGGILAQFNGNDDGGTTALYSVLLYAPYLPTSNAGLAAGMIYRDGASANATLKIV